MQQGGKAQIFKHEEQSYDVAVGFKSMIIGCFVTSPFSLLGKNFLLKCVSSWDTFILNTAKIQLRPKSALFMRHSFNERDKMVCHLRADQGLGQSR